MKTIIASRGQVEGDVLEVVFTGAAHDETVSHRSLVGLIDGFGIEEC